MIDRSKLGIFIGSLSLTISVGYAISSIIHLIDIRNIEPINDAHKHDIAERRKLAIISLAFSSLISIFSTLLIYGISKRLHKFIVPYALLGILLTIWKPIKFVLNLLHFVLRLVSKLPITLLIIIAIVIAVIVIVIIQVFSFYVQKRKENEAKSNKVKPDTK